MITPASLPNPTIPGRCRALAAAPFLSSGAAAFFIPLLVVSVSGVSVMSYQSRAVRSVEVPFVQLVQAQRAPLDLPELLALLMIRDTPVAREVAQALKSEGVILQGVAFRNLRALRYARIKPSGYHELTPMGAARADSLATEAARQRGLHLPMFYQSRGHMRERASYGVRCTCGFHANTGGTGAGIAWQQHIEQITAALPFVDDAPGIVPEGT